MRKVETNNYWKGRAGMDIKAIVLHITDGTFNSALNTFTNPSSYVSAHYLLGRDDEIQLVDEKDSSWACGRVLSPKWKGLEYAKLSGVDIKKLKEYEGAERGEQGNILQPVWDKRLGGFENVINPNLYTLNVEVASKGEFPNWSYWTKVARFYKDLAEKHDLPLDAYHFVNHNEINSRKRCPGRWFNRFWMKMLIKYSL